MASPEVFRTYDIRGIFRKDIDENDAEKIGYVLGQRVKSIAVAMDMRSSSAIMKERMINGMLHASAAVEDIGLVPMGVAMFHAWKSGQTLAYITASHLPKEWAGVKFFHPSGAGFSEKENEEIRDEFFSLKDMKQAGTGIVTKKSSEQAISAYIDFLCSKLKAVKRISVALDCGNGMASVAAKRLFEKAGFSAQGIYDTLSDSPERNSEPNVDPLTALRAARANIGIAYDGDADRMILVDEKGNILSAEKASYLILSELAKDNRGGIVANVECSMSLDEMAEEFNKKVHRQPVGHTHLVENALQKKACLGVESSGHYIIPSLVPYDDALAVSLYAAVALSRMDSPLSEIVKKVPSYPFGRFNYDCPDNKKFAVVEQLKKDFAGYNISTMDGLRIELGQAWVLIRASNTSPLVRMTVEAKEEKSFLKVKDEFGEVLEMAISA